MKKFLAFSIGSLSCMKAVTDIRGNTKPPKIGGLVPRTGFEPAHLAAPPPEDGASTSFATWAGGAKLRKMSSLKALQFPKMQRENQHK